MFTIFHIFTPLIISLISYLLFILRPIFCCHMLMVFFFSWHTKMPVTHYFVELVTGFLAFFQTFSNSFTGKCPIFTVINSKIVKCIVAEDTGIFSKIATTFFFLWHGLLTQYRRETPRVVATISKNMSLLNYMFRGQKNWRFLSPTLEQSHRHIFNYLHGYFKKCHGKIKKHCLS